VLINQGLNLVLTLLFVWWLRGGAIGAALGTLIVAGIMQPAVMWRMGRRFAGVSFSRWLRDTLVPGLVPAAAGTVVWIGMKLWLSPATWTDLAVCEGAGALGFLGVLVAFCLPRPERDTLKNGGMKFAAAFASRMGKPRS
jgi:hypothetical protein